MLLRSGDIETNPGPGQGGSTCVSCGLSMGNYRGPLRCADGCGRLAHKRQACSGLGREGQNRGIWRCGTCGVNSPRAQADDQVPVSPVGTPATPVAGARRRLSWAEVVSQGRRESADGVAVSPEVIRVEADTSVISTDAPSFVVAEGESLDGTPSGVESLANSPQPTWATPPFAFDASTQHERGGVRTPPISPGERRRGNGRIVHSPQREGGGSRGGVATPHPATQTPGQGSGVGARGGVATPQPATLPLGQGQGSQHSPLPPGAVGGSPMGGRGRARQSPLGGAAAPVNTPQVGGGRGRARQSPLGGAAAPVNTPQVGRGRGQARQAGAVAPVNTPGNRAQQADQADVPRGGRKCPTCNTRLVHSGNPLICSCCKAEYHKKCSGLTRHALAAWVASRLWTCATCTCRQRQTDTNNLPSVDSAYGRLGTSSRRSLKVIQWNVDGLATSMADLQGLVRDDPDIDFLMIQETKLLPSNPDPRLPGYSVVRRDRPAPIAGGGPRGGAS